MRKYYNKFFLFTIAVVIAINTSAQVKLPPKESENKAPAKQTTAPKQTNADPAEGKQVLKLTTNADCYLKIDGEDMGLVRVDEVKKVYLNKGAYIIKAISTGNKADVFNTEYNAQEINIQATYPIDLKSIIDQRLAIEEKNLKSEHERISKGRKMLEENKIKYESIVKKEKGFNSSETFVVFSDGTIISVYEFEYYYIKNGGRSNAKDSVLNYLNLLINFKLKVKEAYDQSIHKLQSVQNEFSSYKKQLLKPYTDLGLDSATVLKEIFFKALYSEYVDGVLLFELTDREVWSKAVKDENGRQSYYESNRDNYKDIPASSLNGQLTMDYQNYLENILIERIRKKYSYSLNYENYENYIKTKQY